jgi:hypothetical protein
MQLLHEPVPRLRESDSKAAKSERHSSPSKNRGETKKEVLSEYEGDRRDLCNYCMSQYLD